MSQEEGTAATGPGGRKGSRTVGPRSRWVAQVGAEFHGEDPAGILLGELGRGVWGKREGPGEGVARKPVRSCGFSVAGPLVGGGTALSEWCEEGEAGEGRPR